MRTRGFLLTGTLVVALLLSADPLAIAAPAGPGTLPDGQTEEIAAPAATCDQWDLADEFRTWPNQENPNRDSCGNPGVWRFMASGSLDRDPGSYALMQYFDPDADGIWGLNKWHAPPETIAGERFDLPAVAINATGATQYLYGFTWPPGVVNLHPFQDKMAVVAWQAPITGTVSISGTVKDLHPGGEFTWAIDTQSAELAAGTVSSGSQSFDVSVAVQPGDFVYFAIGPGKDDFYGDSTQLDVRITPTAVSDHKLFIPLVARQRSLLRPPVLASPGDENWSDEFGLPWLNAPVLALADGGAGGVYLGGKFTGDFSYIARWDGHQPHSLGAGTNGRVRALAADSAGNLYAGGSFTTAGGVSALHVARWTASDLREVTGPGSYTLYVDNLPVTVHVTEQDTLARLYAQRHDKSHPNAEPGLDTGYFWEIAGTDAAGNSATGYTVDLTLSTAFNPDAADRVCQITGSTRDCAASARGEYTITRAGLTGLSSFWAVQDNTPSPRQRQLHLPMITRS